MSEKLKILHIIKSLGRGGAEMLLPETLAVHDQEKFEFHYIYFLSWKDQMVASILEAGGKVHCFSANNNIQILLKYTKILTYIENNKIQLVHCHLPWAGFVGRLIYKKSGIPVIYTEHNKQERYHRITFFFNRLTFNWQTLAIAVSGDVAESIKKNIAPDIPVLTILNGVNTDTFQRDHQAGRQLRHSLNIPDNALVIGIVAVFRFQKRLIEWLEVMQEVCLNDRKIFGIIVGDGPLKTEIMNKRWELGIEDKIIMPGLITEVRPWMAAMDIYMMTSIFEGLPVSLLEAMSMECAIISTDAGGIKEVIRNKLDGLTVAVKDWKQLPGLVEIVKDKQKRLILAKNARFRVKESFSLIQMVHELENVYVQYAKVND